MLFNSYPFLFAFLPLVFAGFFLLGRWRIRAATAWLLLMSLFFYGWWNPTYIFLLIGSFLFNFLVGRQIARTAKELPRVSRYALICGVAADLGLLAYYKYSGFFVAQADWALGAHFAVPAIILPLGISFFTFTQIAFLVDCYRGLAGEYDLVNYGLFVTYFPHLIAGPILHHKEMMPQFREPQTYRLQLPNIAIGTTLFVIGLTKKLAFADPMAHFADPVFAGAPTAIGMSQAWIGALAYTLQIYFDFSGYSDMAVGLSRLFNIALPLNFNSPYKSANIIDFWRRWHMTLSRFLRDYLYFPLGGNRKGAARRYANLLATMILGGLWHGAAWTFVIWGLLHGSYLCVNHAVQHLTKRASWRQPSWWPIAGTAATFLAVVTAWVFFRATSTGSAIAILRAMYGGSAFHLAPGEVRQFAIIMLLLCVCWFLPNSQQILQLGNVGEGGAADQPVPAWALWRPSLVHALVAALALATCLVLIGRNDSAFIYYAF